MCHRYQVTLPLVDKGRGGEGQLERWCLVSNYRYVAKLLLRHSNWSHSQCEWVFLDLQLAYYMAYIQPGGAFDVTVTIVHV